MSDAPDMPESSDKRLNRAVAITVVLLSVTMAVTNIKDGNIVQNMQAAQAMQIDTWSEYQATRIKSHVEEIAAAGGGAAARKAADEVAKYTRESATLKAAAESARGDYDHNGFRDDQFDLAEGFGSIALATTAISALAETWWLLFFGWGSGALALLFSAAGFAQLPIHPDLIVGFLT